jgi:hypothetical protein
MGFSPANAGGLNKCVFPQPLEAVLFHGAGYGNYETDLEAVVEMKLPK